MERSELIWILVIPVSSLVEWLLRQLDTMSDKNLSMGMRIESFMGMMSEVVRLMEGWEGVIGDRERGKSRYREEGMMIWI